MTTCVPQARVPAIFLLAIAALTAPAVPAAPAPDTTARILRYAVLANGLPIGSEVDVIDEQGAIDSAYEFNDRGRGPKLRAHYEFASDGLPRRVTVTGVNYLKSAVDEQFGENAEGLRWSGTTGSGSSTQRGFYLTNDGIGGVELAAMVRALQRHPGVPLPLLPAGQARLEAVADTVVESHGRTLHVREFAITGIDLVPDTIWVDDRGDYFASPGRWAATLREGWEDVNEALFALQLKAEDARYQRIATTLARHPAGPLAIEHARLFDSVNALLREDQTVVIDGTTIAAVGASATVHVPEGTERIDGRGRTILPGLFDMHVHASAADGLLHVASGVTTVRDLGNSIDDVHHLQELWDRGAAIGPRMWATGLIDGPGEFKAPTGIYVETPEQVETAVARYAAAGDVQIKLYSSLKPELVPIAIASAHRHGLRISGHVPQGLVASEFVRLGADELQHMNFVLLNFLAGKVGDTRTPERFTAVGEHAVEIDLESPAVKSFVDLLVSHRTTVDVTLGAFEGMLTARPGQPSPDVAPVLSRLPAVLQRQAYGGGWPVSAANDQRFRDAFGVMLRMTKKLFDAGVPVLVGTDGLAGVMLHRELELHVLAGIPTARVLQDATWVASRVLGQESMLGAIAVGKRADLLLVEGNPVEHISDIRRGRLVIKDGVVYDPAALYSALGIAAAP
jgi:cytosine/adenosine deaminase-related metal-dependent hydrolase